MSVRVERIERPVKIVSSPATGWGGSYTADYRQFGGSEQYGWFLNAAEPVTNKAQATALIELFTAMREELDR